MKIIRVDTGEVIFEKVAMADTFSSRLRGLMGLKGLSDGECILISPCSSIHTFFMKFDIDVAFLDKDYRVLKIERNIQPGKVIMPVKKARYVIESDSRYGNLGIVEEGQILKVIKD